MSINKALVTEAVKFFENFKHVFNSLEPINSITSNLVILVTHILKEKLLQQIEEYHLKNDFDGQTFEALECLSNCIIGQIDLKVVPAIQDVHYAATLLDPNLNSLLCLKPYDREEAIQKGSLYIKNAMKDYDIIEVNFLIIIPKINLANIKVSCCFKIECSKQFITN